MKQKVVLYNPKAVLFDNPLALLAIASSLGASKYEVVIVDGRLEPNPLKAGAEQIADATVGLPYLRVAHLQTLFRCHGS